MANGSKASIQQKAISPNLGFEEVLIAPSLSKGIASVYQAASKGMVTICAEDYAYVMRPNTEVSFSIKDVKYIIPVDKKNRLYQCDTARFFTDAKSLIKSQEAANASAIADEIDGDESS
jgi:hypothetical protein